jgi:DNA-directed RNA polymerase specialized sigma24 family protein
MGSAGSRRTEDGIGPVACLQDAESMIQDCRPRIFRFLLVSLGDAELAGTLTQCCLEKAFEQKTFWDKSNAKIWLMRIAVDLQMRQIKMWRWRFFFWRKPRIRTAVLAFLNDWLPDDQQTMEDRSRTRERAKRVWSGVFELSNDQRIVFLLFFTEGMNCYEIAEVTGLPAYKSRDLLVQAVGVIRSSVS